MTEALTRSQAALRYQQALDTFGGRNRDEIDRDIKWDSPAEWQRAYDELTTLEWLVDGRTGG